MPDEKKSDAKTFDLTNNESNLLGFMERQQQAMFSALLSNIAATRLAYTVTERTQFKVSRDEKTGQMVRLEISEQAEEVPVAKKPDTEDSPVKKAA